MCLFFFFKQKTAYELRISDWSSDVCSSDPEEAEASHHKHARHDLLLIVKSLHLAHRFFSPLTGRAGRRLYNGDDSALVLLRKEAARETRERSEEHTSELQSLMRISYAVFCLKKKKNTSNLKHQNTITQR